MNEFKEVLVNSNGEIIGGFEATTKLKKDSLFRIPGNPNFRVKDVKKILIVEVQKIEN